MSDDFDLEGFIKRAREALADSSPENDHAALQVLTPIFHKTVPWANQIPRSEDTAQPNVGVGVAMYYPHPDGKIRLIMVEPNANEGKYQMPGGFMEFAVHETERNPKTGEIVIIGDAKPEQQGEAVVREIGEELRGKDGPILGNVGISRMTKMDQLTVVVRGQAVMVNGYMIELTKAEYEHVEALSLSGEGVIYSHKDEIKHVHCMLLEDFINNPGLLAHVDQLSLFKKVQEYLNLETPEERLEFLSHALT